MPDWKMVDTTRVPSGGHLVLWRRGEEYVIRVDGEDLMGSEDSHSERALATYGCMGLRLVRDARVLVGGLGMGFTLRAALEVVRTDAEVDVAELVPGVVDWNRGPLAHLAGRPLEDQRVRVVEADVSLVLRGSHARYDAILLDVDNGPEALTSPSNDALYGRAGLARARRALRPNGVFAVWSAHDDGRFSRRLRQEGFHTRTEYVSARPHGGRRHTIWLAEPMRHHREHHGHDRD
jgi:spermidine synthase